MTTKPCTFLDPSPDADEDLARDTMNMECGRKLRLQVYELQADLRAIREARQ